MWGKLAGSLLLVMLAGGWTWQRNCRRRRLLRREAAWLSLLSRIREEVSAFSAPLPRILSGIHPERLSETGETPAALTENFSAACFHSAGLLAGEFGKTLGEMAGEIGKIWRAEELAREDAWLARLREAYREDREQTERAARLEGVLTLCAALGIILILW